MPQEEIEKYGMAVRLRNKLEAEFGLIFEAAKTETGCYMVRPYGATRESEAECRS